MLTFNPYIPRALLALGLLISGCASGPTVHKIDIGASTNIENPENVTEGNIGIYYEPSLVNYVHVQSISDDIATVNAGQASTALFNEAIPKVFEKTELVTKMPPYEVAETQLDGIVEPRLDYVNWRMFFDSEEDFFHVAYTFIFYTSKGVPISKWTIIGQGPQLSDQITDAAQKFVDNFSIAPETKRFREYLKKKRVNKVDFNVDDIYIEASIKDENELGLRLKEAGILPVQVSVKNETGSDITGRGFDVRLIYADGKRLVPAFPLAVVSTFEFQAAVNASDPALVGTFFGLPGLFGSMFGSHSARVDARKQQAEYFEKSRLKEVTLASGDSIEGVLYFVLPPDLVQLDDAKLSFWFIDKAAANGERKTVSLSEINYRISEITKSAYEKTTGIYSPTVIGYVPSISYVRPDGGIDLTGSYDVKITRDVMPGYGSTNKYYCFNGKRSFTLDLIQDGYNIKGSFLSGKAELSGSRSTWGDGFDFVYTTSRCPNRKTGRWTLNQDGSSLEGYGWSEIKWKLQKKR